MKLTGKGDAEQSRAGYGFYFKMIRQTSVRVFYFANGKNTFVNRIKQCDWANAHALMLE